MSKTKKHQPAPAPVLVEKKFILNLVNPAPVITSENLASATEQNGGIEPKHRGNTAWFVHVPLFGLNMIVRDDNGNPVTGYIDYEKVRDDVCTKIEKAVATPGLMQALQGTQEIYEGLEPGQYKAITTVGSILVSQTPA